MIAPPDPPQAGRRDRVPGRIGPLLVAVAIVVAVVLGCDALRGPDRPDPLVTTASPPSPSTSVPTEAVATDASPTAATAPVTATVTASTAAASTPAAATSAPAGPVADGSIALIDGNGALVTVDAGGGSRVSYPVPGIATGFPAWSPDGSRIAVVAQGAEATAVAVHEVDRDAGAAGEPTVVYRSRDRLPFYLYWTPDSRHVSFLTGEPVGLALRVAAVDGSADSDAVDETSVVRRGSPLYVQWIVADRALLHVGGGTDAFTGRVDLDGNVIGGPLEANGAFRAPGLSRSGRYVTYARSVADGTGEIVVESTEGSASHTIPTFGPAAMLFHPVDDTLATIAADQPDAEQVGFPVGPLRLIDPSSGAVRTVLDGSVLACFWAPDGRTIAALRLIDVAPGPISVVGRTVLARTDTLAARADPRGEAASVGIRVSVAFIDVDTGTLRSEQVVRVADTFLTQLFPYFDQYALSHRLWSPESASILLPLVAASGPDQLVTIPADGTDPRPVADGELGFWSP